MFRMRRYRVYLVFAVIAIGALYHFTTLGGIENAGAASVEGLKSLGYKIDPSQNSQRGSEDESASDSTRGSMAVPSLVSWEKNGPSASAATQGRASGTSSPSWTTPVGTGGGIRADDKDESLASASHAGKTPENQPNKTIAASGSPAKPNIEPGGSQGRLEIIAETTVPKIHWSQLPEHFPVPTDNLIDLPMGKSKSIPKIQHDFKSESSVNKVAREEKLDLIRNTFTFSWDGYRQKAWMQDELSPQSGKYRNPFCGWGATLVDSLDTLWMLGLRSEFDEAVEAVKDIDFTTSMRNEIPLFETVIRYLGGLVAAYDISGGSYRILLDKAVELADILMGAFDTPNRMPMTFYLWKPTFASQPHRAKTRVVLAELGSLSVEFTRLAQITKEAKYYDAIARITNEFDIWQSKTKVPGLWPQKVDASGCKKPDDSSTYTTKLAESAKKNLNNNKPMKIEDTTGIVDPRIESNSTKKGQGPNASSSYVASIYATPASESRSEDTVSRSPPQGGKFVKRDAQKDPQKASTEEASSKTPDCEPQGLASPPYSKTEDFSLGGEADSTYEYLPKEYMLLGGLEDKYRTMYEFAADTTKKRMLYRLMIPDEKRYILGAGSMRATGEEDPDDKSSLKPEGAHLTCFLGGMFAVGAKIFDRKDDMDVAKKLTDGCVWAYEATTTGIMPEGYMAIACPDSGDCPWNETLWYDSLDPAYEMRERSRIAQQQKQVVLDNGKSTDKNVEEKALTIAQETNSPKATQLSNELLVSSESSTLESAERSALKPSNDITKSPLSNVPEEKLEKASVKPVEGAAPPKDRLLKRQLGDLEEDATKTDAGSKIRSSKDAVNDTIAEAADEPDQSGSVLPAGQSLTENQDTQASQDSNTDVIPAYEEPPIPTREEFVKAKIEDEGLPLGMTKITGARYLLRPEAIESVFIMYRATGDDYWREKGWDMFQAIEKYTNTTFGASAISDVTSENPRVLDEMESFWLAETLKYFFLLFSDPSVVSLDEYVLNTEAHPFKRPK